MTPPTTHILFPSDLRTAPAAPMTLAGRIVKKEPGALYVADAFATVRLAGVLDVDVGDLVVVSVSGENRQALSILERHRSQSTRASEQTRFVHEGVGANLLARSHAFDVVRSFFAARAFVEVDTPLLVPSPGLDLHLDAVEATGGWLITSPEYQMKRLLSGGVPRLFQISHVFRREEIGELHNPEFSMLEWYRAFASVHEIMRDTEELVAEIIHSVAGTHLIQGPAVAVDTTPPFARITVEQAFDRFANVPSERFFAMAEHDHETFFRTLVDRVEPALSSLTGPVFLVDYPISQASLARPKPNNPRLAERFELYLGGIELCNGFGELTDAGEQRRRLLADQEARRLAGKAIYPIDERFLGALEEGMPPSAGNALGLDRLVALCLGEREIGRVMPFPEGVL